MKKFFFTIISFCLLSLLGLYMIGWILTKPTNQTVADCPKELNCKRVEFYSESDTNLIGWLVEGKAGKGMVIIMHGVRGNRSQMIERIKFLNKANFSVLAFDFQSHGESIGDQITFGYKERLDSDAAINYVNRKFPNEKIGVLGISMGGAAFLLSDEIQTADSVIFEMVYSTMEKAVENRLNMWLFDGAERFEPILTAQFYPHMGVSINDLRPIDKIDKVKIPKLFIAGEKDLHTTLKESEELFNKALEPKNIWVVPGAKHEDLHKKNKELYEDKVTAFFENNLATR